MSEGQLFLIGIVASFIAYVLKAIASTGWKPTREQVAVGLYVVSFGLAVWFSGLGFPAFPPFADAPTFASALLTYIGQLLALASPVAGMAYLIYNVLLKRIFDAVTVKLFKK